MNCDPLSSLFLKGPNDDWVFLSSKDYKFPILLKLTMISLFFASELRLSRVDADSLPEQDLMEITVAGLELDALRHAFKEGDNFRDVCDWDGITCDEGVVTEMHWEASPLRGSIFLDKLPRHLENLHLRRRGDFPRKFHGTLETDMMPNTLDVLDITGNEFHGTVDFLSLPAELETFRVQKNGFSGSVSLDGLPQSLKHLAVGENEFMGSLNLTALPESLLILTAEQNHFSGEISLSNLPPFMEILDIAANELHGMIRFDSLPKKLEKLMLNDNEFQGTIDAIQLPRSLMLLHIQNNKLSGSMQYGALPPLFHLMVQGNSFEGEHPDIDRRRRW